MRHWGLSFQVYRPISSFPYPGHIEVETQNHPSYHCEGHLRHGNSQLFVYTLRGQGCFRAGETEFSMTPGKGFLCWSADSNIAWYYPEHTRKPWKFIWISFFGETAGKMVFDMVGRYGHIYKLPIDSALITRLITFRMHHGPIYALTPHAGAEIVYNLLTSLAAITETEYIQDTETLLVRQVQKLILEKIRQDISVEKIAGTLKMSREHLSRIFKKQTGISPSKYILRQKILLACRMLKETRLSCKEIAAELHYDNATNFSRAFHNLIRMTPKQFRLTGTIPLG